MPEYTSKLPTYLLKHFVTYSRLRYGMFGLTVDWCSKRLSFISMIQEISFLLVIYMAFSRVVILISFSSEKSVSLTALKSERRLDLSLNKSLNTVSLYFLFTVSLFICSPSRQKKPLILNKNFLPYKIRLDIKH